MLVNQKENFVFFSDHQALLGTLNAKPLSNSDWKWLSSLARTHCLPSLSCAKKAICLMLRNNCNILICRVVPIGEASVIIAVSSAHRKNSLEAVQYCIDTLKATVPIWKKVLFFILKVQWSVPVLVKILECTS